MLRDLLQNQGYAFVGDHSAVKLCTWTKKSLKDNGFCYKQQFYGIQSHLCCQISPSIGFCQNKCVYCWREIDLVSGIRMNTPDDPQKIVENSVIAQRKLLSGFGGDPDVNKSKFKEAQFPKHYAISLSGEPTIYPKLNELIKILHSMKKTTFLVTNGLLPARLAKIEPPTQLYISIEAPNQSLYKKIVRSAYKDAWTRQQKSLTILKSLKKNTKTVLRLTMIKGLNMLAPEDYAKIIARADPDFVEVKGYMFVGSSRQRLSMANMPLHSEVKQFAELIAKESGLSIKDEKKESRVVLLS
ncbi:MAG: 4-demethylwyosine synthase TYW1 [Candidatus Woesearchaeota archaeon]